MGQTQILLLRCQRKINHAIVFSYFSLQFLQYLGFASDPHFLQYLQILVSAKVAFVLLVYNLRIRIYLKFFRFVFHNGAVHIVFIFDLIADKCCLLYPLFSLILVVVRVVACLEFDYAKINYHSLVTNKAWCMNQQSTKIK